MLVPMTDKSKTITISNVTYAMAVELGENYNFLERLVDAGKVRKATFDGNNYYDVAAVKKVVGEMRTIPNGYVRAVDHAILMGSDSRIASTICNKQGAQARKVLVGGTKPAWYAEKVWFEKQIQKYLKASPKTSAPVVTPTKTPVKTLTQDQANANAIQQLMSTIAELRDTIQSMTSAAPATSKPQRMTEDEARAAGFRPLNELATELEVSASTLRGWQHRRQVRAVKVVGKTFLNVEDVEAMYLKLDENRAILATRMQGRSNNNLRNGHS